MKQPSDQKLTEYSFQKENGVLDPLQRSLLYTYSFFPDDSIKNDVELKVWQKHVHGWNLLCDNATLIAAKEQLSAKIEQAGVSSVYELRELIDNRYIGMLAASLIFIVWPAYPLVTAPVLIGLTARPLYLSYQLINELNEQNSTKSLTVEISEEYNACLSPDDKFAIDSVNVTPYTEKALWKAK